VQENAIAHPTDARLTHRAIEKLVETAKREGVELRQSYLRVAKRGAIMVGRYTHAHQFKRARRELKFLRTRLGRIIRDVRQYRRYTIVDTANLPIIVITVLVLGGSARYIRGHWF